MIQGSLQVGITGGIGAGKSLICSVFKQLGIPIYDADASAKALMSSDAKLKSQIILEFGDEAYDVHDNLNRDYLAKTIFGNETLRNKLNALVHPAVAEDYRHWCTQHTKSPILLREAALLIETGTYKQLDKLIVVTAPEKLRIHRVLMRDTHRNAEQIAKIIDSQISEQQSKEVADFIVVNDEKSMILPQILQIHQTLLTFVNQ